MNKKDKFNIKNIPNKPGVYQFYDQNNDIIYVGKSKNLKKRIQSYFIKNHTSKRLEILMSKIYRIETIILNNEVDALLLENNLIKTNSPKYNILLKDDKTFPWICIKNERFPRIFITRNKINDGSTYFGPYSNITIPKTIMSIIQEIYYIRSCNYDLKINKIKKSTYKLCLEYHINNCKGPCVELQSEESYNKQIKLIKNLLNGEFKYCKKYLKDKMNLYSNNMEYEKAEIIKNKIDILNNYQSKSCIISSIIEKADFFSIVSDKQNAYINYICVNNGSIIKSFNKKIEKKLNETDEYILEKYIFFYYSENNEIPYKVYVNKVINLLLNKCNIKIPKIGESKKIIDISIKNALEFKIKSNYIINNNVIDKTVLTELYSLLNLKKIPFKIEAFDNSNIQGINNISSCIRFEDGIPNKNKYKIFNINEHIINDFELIYKAVLKRYNTKEDLPNLILIDGGKGQLKYGYKALKELNIHNHIEIISIAKKREEIFKIYNKSSIILDKKNEALKLLQRIRDEAHIFALKHHSKLRQKQFYSSILHNIPGIGIKTIYKLLYNYKSINNIKNADIKDILKLIGKKKTEILLKNIIK